MTPSPIRVLVTAVGGDLGQTLVKALRLANMPFEIHGCDIDAKSVGSVFVDYFHTVPPAKDESGYLDFLDSLCRSFRIEVIVPACDQEIAILSQLGSPPRLQCGSIAVCQEASWIESYGDKLNCMHALQDKVKLALFADGSNREAVDHLVSQIGFPLVVKSRRSSGSRTLHIARTQAELEEYLAKIPLPLVQDYIEDAGGEFSVGVFVCDRFRTAIAFRRELGLRGCSWFAEVSQDPAVLDYAYQVAEASELRGSANIQVRKGKEGVRLLEINPRFSSLVAARALCGFRDAEWSIQMALGREPTPPEGDYLHIRFQRFIHEVVDFGTGFQAIAQWGPRRVRTIAKKTESKR